MSASSQEFYDTINHLIKVSKLGRMGLIAHIGASVIVKRQTGLSVENCSKVLEQYAIQYFMDRESWQADFTRFVGNVEGAVWSIAFGHLRARCWPVDHANYLSVDQLMVFAQEEIPAGVFGSEKETAWGPEIEDVIRRCVCEIVLLTV